MNLFRNLKKGHYILLGVWFLINLLQAIFTDLHSDESYYWVYSQNLAWGFFDHPPMVALLIKAGYSILQIELGVRLFFITLSTFTMAIIINEINEQKDLFFLGVFVLSFPLIHTHIGGFLAIPDIPLVFFTLLFFVLYRKFLEEPGLKISIVLAIIVAAMVYSKYHAILIIFLTLLANLKLLKNKYFWVIVLLSILLLFPHIWWQIDNQLPSFRYHLSGRAKPFRFKYVHSNLLGQLLMAGPLTGIIVFWKVWKFKIRDVFERTLVFTIAGFYVVLFIFSFWNRIEAHWIAAVIPLLMLVSYPLITNDPNSKKWFIRLALPTIILLFLFRIYIGSNAIPNIGSSKITFYKRGDVAKEIQQLANGKKVGFFDNYAFISNYIFYTGEEAVMLSNPGYRFCQYDLLNDEASADGDSLFIVYPWRKSPVELSEVCNGEKKGFKVIEEFQSLKGLKISINNIKETKGFFELDITMQNKTGKIIFLTTPSEPSIGWIQGDKETSLSSIYNIINKESLNREETVTLIIHIPSSEIDKGKPFSIYTHTSENNRGEIVTLKF